MSATSTDLRSCRAAACAALEAHGHEPRFQERFDHGYRRLEDFLKDRVAECVAVVCLVGDAFGAEPEDRGATRRSYTQLEYDVARNLGRPIFVYFTSSSFVPDAPPEQGPERAARQQAHREALRRSHIWREFSSVEELRSLVEEFSGQIPRILPLRLHEDLRPPPPAFFSGRAAEMEQLTQAVRRSTPSLIAVIGMGGQGKTALVDRWVREQPRLDWVRGAWFSLDRSGITFDEFLDRALSFLLAEAYDKREMPDPAQRAARLLDLLRESPALLVLDGVERWLRGWSGDRDQPEEADTDEMRGGKSQALDEFLQQAGTLSNGSHVVLTTRALPAALDDIDCTIVPVRDESQFDSTLQGLDSPAAAELLERLGVQGSDADRKEVARSYQCHPLALTVLGGLLRKMYGGQLENLPRVTPLDPKRSLHALLAETLRHLPTGELARSFLSVAAHALEDPPLAAVAHAMPGHDVDELRTLSVTMADWNLLRWDGARQAVRLHPLVQQYLVGLLEADASRAIHARYADWYAGLSLPAAPSTLEQVAPRVLAIKHALRAANPPRCAELVFSRVSGDYAFVDWAQAWGHHTAAIELLGRIAAASHPRLRAALITPCAALQRQLGKLEEARENLDEAISLLDPGRATASPDTVADLAGALINRGNVLRDLSLPDLALDDLNRALHLLETLPYDDPVRLLHLPGTLMNRGIALREAGRFSKAAVDCERAAELFRALVSAGQSGLRPVLASAETNSGIAVTELERYDEALEAYGRAIGIYESLIAEGRLEFVPDLANLRVTKAAVLSEAGSDDEAIREIDEALRTLRELVDARRGDLEFRLALAVLGRSQAHLGLQEWRAAQADADDAITRFGSLVDAGRLELRGWLAFALLNRAHAHYGLGDGVHSQEDRSRGFEILDDLIAAGEPETRVLYMRKSAGATRYLIGEHAAEALLVLGRAVREIEQGIADGDTVEAIQLEAQRALRELGDLATAEPALTPLIERLMRCAPNRQA